MVVAVTAERGGPLAGARRIFNRMRSRGAREVLTLLLHRVRENLWSSETLVLYVAVTSDAPRPPEGALARFADPSDAERYARDIGTDSASTFRERLTSDTRCFIVEDEGKILHSSWVTTGKAWTREIRGYLMPPEGDAYVYESFTRADARGRGLYPYALAHLLSQLAAGSIERLWVGVEDSNAPSRRAISKAGLESGFSLTYRRRFGMLFLDPPQGALAGAGGTFLRGRKGA